MNKLFVISVSKKIIFDRIRLFTSYLAGKRSENPLDYDRVAAIGLDLPLLGHIADDAATSLASNLVKMVNSFRIEDDVLRFELISPLGAASEGSGGIDTTLIYNLMESFILSETIMRWLTIVGYDFSDSGVSIRKSAEEVAASKLALLQAALDPGGLSTRKRVLKASSRRVPPM